MPTAETNTHLSERQQIANFWLPSLTDWLFYFVTSSIIFGILNAETLWQYFNSRVLGAEQAVSSDYSPLTQPLFNFINSHDTWVMLLVWGVIGCVVFALVLGFQNIFKTARQEVAESRYKVGGASVNPQYWQNVARLDLSFAGLAVGWIVFFAMYLNGILPWVSHEFFSGLAGSWADGYKIILALLVNTLVFYLLVKFTHVLASTWRLIRPNE